MTFRRKLAHELDPRLKGTLGLSLTNKVIMGLILFSLLIAIMATESSFYAEHVQAFLISESILTGLFALEYIARLWVCVENPLYRSRWHYFMTASALLDLLVVILFVATTMGAEGFLLRLSRLLRLLRIARLGHYSVAINNIKFALNERRDELLLSLGIALVILLISSSALYFVEGDAQPEKFGSIPRAMWWSAITLTTVGYGDVYPITPLGKVIASITAIAGIGLIAMPAGILAGSFSDAMQRHRRHKKNEDSAA
ncbi:potassium channel family protein [Legionella sp. CNM-4043-24]|uniref:potassium channel family protein n=1 Tax=Legionella sp. CNM-4043-24 TaxID=3421646 RepID=UPI00403AF25E